MLFTHFCLCQEKKRKPGLYLQQAGSKRGGDADCILTALYFLKLVGAPFANEKDLTHIV